MPQIPQKFVTFCPVDNTPIPGNQVKYNCLISRTLPRLFYNIYYFLNIQNSFNNTNKIAVFIVNPYANISLIDICTFIIFNILYIQAFFLGDLPPLFISLVIVGGFSRLSNIGSVFVCHKDFAKNLKAIFLFIKFLIPP